MEWDGIKIEEMKMRDAKCPNPKSRGNYAVGICLKECANRGKKCGECVGYSLLKETG
jgi:hypothetical protein